MAGCAGAEERHRRSLTQFDAGADQNQIYYSNEMVIPNTTEVLGLTRFMRVLRMGQRAGMGRTCALPPAERALRSHARHSRGAKCRPSPPQTPAALPLPSAGMVTWRTAGSETGTFAMVQSFHHTCSFSYRRLENSLCNLYVYRVSVDSFLHTSCKKHSISQ